MNRVVPCPPKTDIFVLYSSGLIPNPLNLPYISVHTCITHHSIPIYCLTYHKIRTTIDSSLGLFPAVRNTSPLELNITRYQSTHSFHRHHTLFHQSRCSIQLTSSKLLEDYDNMRCVTSYFLIRLALSKFGKSIMLTTRLKMISAIASVPQAPHTRNLQVQSGIQWTQYSFDHNSAVSGHIHHYPLHT